MSPKTVAAHPSLLALPAASALVSTLARRTNWAFYLTTTPLGFILFGLSLYKAQKSQVE